jgi:hypothetical protein
MLTTSKYVQIYHAETHNLTLCVSETLVNTNELFFSGTCVHTLGYLVKNQI